MRNSDSLNHLCTFVGYATGWQSALSPCAIRQQRLRKDNNWNTFCLKSSASLLSRSDDKMKMPRAKHHAIKAYKGRGCHGPYIFGFHGEVTSRLLGCDAV